MSKTTTSELAQSPELQTNIHDRFTLFMDSNELMEYFANIEKRRSDSAYHRRYYRAKSKKTQTA